MEKEQIIPELERITIGRNADNNVVLSQTNITRYHAVITVCGPTVFLLEDLDSKHGTFINGERIKRKLVTENDKVTLATNEYVLKNLLHVKKKEPIETKPKDNPLDFTVEFIILEFVYEEYVKNKKNTKGLEKSVRKWSVIGAGIAGLTATALSGGTLTVFLGLATLAKTYMGTAAMASAFSATGLGILIPTMASDFLSTEEKIELLKKELGDKYRCPQCKLSFGERPYSELVAQKKCSKCNAIWVK